MYHVPGGTRPAAATTPLPCEATRAPHATVLATARGTDASATTAPYLACHTVSGVGQQTTTLHHLTCTILCSHRWIRPTNDTAHPVRFAPNTTSNATQKQQYRRHPGHTSASNVSQAQVHSMPTPIQCCTPWMAAPTRKVGLHGRYPAVPKGKLAVPHAERCDILYARPSPRNNLHTSAHSCQASVWPCQTIIPTRHVPDAAPAARALAPSPAQRFFLLSFLPPAVVPPPVVLSALMLAPPAALFCAQQGRKGGTHYARWQSMHVV